MRKFIVMLAPILFIAHAIAAGPLALSCVGQSHPCGLYHPGDTGTLIIRVENVGKTAQILSGNLRWACQPEDQREHILISTAMTPVRATSISPGQVMRLSLPVKFNELGTYQVLWRDKPVPMDAHIPPPICMYAPAIHNNVAGPWIALPPPMFLQEHSRGFIGSYIRETGMSQYLFNADLAPNGRINFRNITPSLAETINNAGGSIILRISIPLHGWKRGREIHVRALATSIEPLVSSCRAVVLHFSSFGPATPAATRAAATLLTTLHIASDIWKLPVRLFATPDIIGTLAGQKGVANLIGGVALTDTFTSMRMCHAIQSAGGALPVMILPPPDLSQQVPSAKLPPDPALFLAAAAEYVPVPQLPGNFELHVLGAAPLYAIVHPHLPLLAGVFEEPYGSVAVIAGLGAQSLRDQKWNNWRAHPPLIVTDKIWHQAVRDGLAGWHRLRAMLPQPGHFPQGKMIVVDAEGLMRTRGTTGNTVPSPYPGWQEIPLNDHVYFLTYPGNPTQLVAAIRTAEIKGLPLACISIGQHNKQNGPQSLILNIRNARIGRLQGTITLASPPPSGIPAASWRIGQAAQFGPIHRGRSVPVRVTLGKIAQYSGPGKHRILAILHWRKWVQITTLSARNFRPDQNMAGESSTASAQPMAATQASTTAIPSRPSEGHIGRPNKGKPTSEAVRRKVSTTRPRSYPNMPLPKIAQ